MPRVRLGVVIVVPEPVATEIQGLRRALGDPVLDRIMPHVTLVPPVNVRVDDIGAALSAIRSAAAAARPLPFELVAPRTFGPGSPTLYLPVEGDAAALEGLDRLRAAVFVPPLEREVDHEFVPHVTVAAELVPDRLARAIGALADFRGSFVADTLTLLRFEPGPPSGRWEPFADARLARPAVIGRGGLELELTQGSMLDPEASALLARADRLAAALERFDRPAAHGVAPGARTIVITARRRGAVVGVGWAHAWPGASPGDCQGDLEAVVEAPDAAGVGVERQITMALRSAIASA